MVTLSLSGCVLYTSVASRILQVVAPSCRCNWVTAGCPQLFSHAHRHSKFTLNTLVPVLFLNCEKMFVYLLTSF